MKIFKNFWILAVLCMAVIMGSCSKEDPMADVNSFEMAPLAGEWVNVADEFETITCTNVNEYRCQISWVQDRVVTGTLEKVANWKDGFQITGTSSGGRWNLYISWDNKEHKQFTMRGMPNVTGSTIAEPRTFKRK